ncbi:MAG: hypothetical protein KC474_08860, partial [Cyanobacteria bacterium HKST-UBA04]|nr:hypothetical protein [Cyanobacteria bacterium HKST-UBA04]
MARDPQTYLTLVAIGVLVILGLKSALELDRWFDTWSYHLPFAARLWGIVGPDQFDFQHRTSWFAGFTKLGHWLEGGVWALTGRASTASLVSYFSFVALVMASARLLRLSFAMVCFAFLNVPLLGYLIRVTSNDLLDNMFATLMILCAMRWYWCTGKETQAPGTRLYWLGAVVVLGALATYTKFQMVPVVVFTLTAVACRAVYVAWRDLGNGWAFLRWIVLKLLPISMAVFGLVFFFNLKNMVVYAHTPYLSNPFYPITLEGMGLYVPGVVSGDFRNYLAPDHLETMPQPYLWGISMLRDWGGLNPWHLKSGVLGGYGLIYLTFHLVWFMVNALWSTCTHKKTYVAVMLVLTLTTPFLPNAFVLRYYLYWFILLILFNCVMAGGLFSFAPAWRKQYQVVL